ncbi:ABC transporter permease [Nonomuraea sp. NPDC050790]|uniref:ABC transporter permease n=1 Tax=Nonomuraea sp. NPDC050790 TaxID=3364371 RepID=UPI003793DA17
MLTLSWRLLRGGGRQGMLGTWLTFGAVAISTALLLFAVSANFAFDARADRGAWRNPVAAGSGAVAIEAQRYDFVRDRQITVIDLAAAAPGPDPASGSASGKPAASTPGSASQKPVLSTSGSASQKPAASVPGSASGMTTASAFTPLSASASLPAPPGLPRFPAPGEVWLSPALAALVKELPRDQLGGRYPKVAGQIGDEGLVHPDELVAVIGHRPGDAAMTAPRSEDWIVGTPPTKIASFAGTESEDAEAYKILALIATVLMIVPLLVFGGAAARLTVARRDQRLASLRLIGATPGQVATMTVAEAVIVALAGALTGAILYGVAVPLLSRIQIGGGVWYLSDLWPSPLVLAATLVAVPLLVGLSAVAGLRRVVVSPLGVAKRETPPGLRFLRVVALIAVLAAVPMLSTNTSVGVIAVVIGLAFLCINLAGPWVVALIGRITAGSARRPARLLAGRRLVDDPRSAWRTVSGVALTGFVAGFLGLLSPSAFSSDPGPAQLRVVVTSGPVGEAVKKAEDRLSKAGVAATVKAEKKMVVAALGSTADAAVIDRARTALDGLSPGRTPTTESDDQRFGTQMLADVGAGTVVVLSVSFLVAIASSGITAASSVLDRRQTYALLRLAGTPLSVLDKARRAETLIPLTVMGGGAIAVGAFCAMPFMLGSVSVNGLITLVVCVVLGFAGVMGAGALSRPLLRSVTADPAPRPD